MKKGYPILIIFGKHISDKTGHQMTVQFPASPNVCFCITWEKQNRQNVHQNQQKTFLKFHLSRYVATNSQSILQSLTVVQHDVY